MERQKEQERFQYRQQAKERDIKDFLTPSGAANRIRGDKRKVKENGKGESSLASVGVQGESRRLLDLLEAQLDSEE